MNFKNATDEELMSAYVLGNGLAFGELFQRYKSRVYGYISQRIYDKSLLDDVFQNTFMRLHHSRDRYSESLPFAPWIFAICKNTVMDAIKSEMRKANLKESVQREQSINSENSPSLDSFGKIIESLPPESAEALKLRYVDELDFNEISKRIGKSPSNVRQILSRAIRSLRGKKHDES